MVLQVLIQYSPSVQLYGIGPDHASFSDQQRAALSGFNDATPDKQSFTDKRSLIRTRSMSSSVTTLASTLRSLFNSLDSAFNAFELAHAALVDLPLDSASHGVLQRKQFEEDLKAAKKIVIERRFTYAKVLRILKEGLDSDGWPEDDAAVTFPRLKHNEPLPSIIEEHSRRADISAQMSLQYKLSQSAGQKRAHDQTNDEEEEEAGGDSTENPDAKRIRKDKGGEGSEEDAAEPPNTEASDCEGVMSVYGGTESGEDEIERDLGFLDMPSPWESA
jgi:hypothetical protein